MRHHDPNFAGDARSLQKAMEENHREYPNKIMDIKRTIAEGDLVVVHSRLRIHSGDKFGMALMHIFRFENGQIAELWDLGQPVEEDFPNDNGMF